MAEKVLELENVTKLYKNGRGASKISFSLEPGDVLGLLGPNGSGKTTTMKVVVGLCHADSGSVRIFGHDIEMEYEVAMERVGSLIEAPALYDYLSAYNNLKLAANNYTEITSQDIERVLELVHLEKYRKDKVARFSLGMKQRMGLALALISSPGLVVLDEPVNGLDIEGIVEIRGIIKKMAEENGTAFLISSHMAAEIEKTCNKVAVIYESELLSFDTMEEALRLNPTLEDYFLEKVRKKRGGMI